jgi:hypothetical protein
MKNIKKPDKGHDHMLESMAMRMTTARVEATQALARAASSRLQTLLFSPRPL